MNTGFFVSWYMRCIIFSVIYPRTSHFLGVCGIYIVLIVLSFVVTLLVDTNVLYSEADCSGLNDSLYSRNRRRDILESSVISHLQREDPLHFEQLQNLYRIRKRDIYHFSLSVVEGYTIGPDEIQPAFPRTIRNPNNLPGLGHIRILEDIPVDADVPIVEKTSWYSWFCKNASLFFSIGAGIFATIQYVGEHPALVKEYLWDAIDWIATFFQ